MFFKKCLFIFRRGAEYVVKDIVTLSLANCHRTTFGKFLSQGVWNIEYAWRAIRREVIRVIYHYSQYQSTPILLRVKPFTLS
jgi:hypothetical protein